MIRSLARRLYWSAVNAQRRLATGFRYRAEPDVQWRGSGEFHVGKQAYVGSRTVLTAGPGTVVRIGDSVWIGSDCELSALGVVSIGAGTTLQHRSQLHGEVVLGAGCTCAAGLYVSSGSHEFRMAPHLPIRLQDRVRARCPTSERSRPVTIGEDCWLGICVAIMPGVTIGRGCVVGANSVVTADVPPYSVVAGVPARIVGTRLDFRPPRRINALRGDDLPYFYAGFSQISTDEHMSEPPRERGGLVATGNFTLALAADGGEALELEVSALVAGEIQHGTLRVAVPPGRSLHVVPAAPDGAGFLQFLWISPASGSIVVVEARVVERGAA